MLTSTRAVTRAHSTAHPLPEVPALASWYAQGVRPRRGEVVMIAGMPKMAKSNFAEWYVCELDVPTLYISADMTSYQAITRQLSWASGNSIQSVRAGMEGPGIDYYADLLNESKIQWCFDSSPSPDDIVLEVDAYVEAWDAYPEVIVVDNLMNVQASEEFAGQQWIMSELHSLARLTGACVIVLHHCSEAGQSDTTVPPPRKAIMNKVSQLPEWVFTVALAPDVNEFRIATVAARNAPCDPSGKTFVRLRSDIERCQFTYLSNLSQSWSYAPED